MGKKLTVYLIDGNDSGPRTIEIGNWSGKALYSPRNALIHQMDRAELSRPGVYVLKADPDDDSYLDKVYIGEAENVGKRLRQHLRNTDKDFKECIIFTSSDNLLNKSTIKYIESRLVTLALEAKNSEVENGNVPKSTALSEADRSDMDQFIDQMRLILPVAGFTFLVSSISKGGLGTDGKPPVGKAFHLRSRAYVAQMVEVDNGFMVLKGGTASPKTSGSISQGWKKLRDSLIKKKVLVKGPKGFNFSTNYTFSSVSAASSIILGRQSAGPLEWISKEGKTYKAYQMDQVGKDS